MSGKEGTGDNFTSNQSRIDPKKLSLGELFFDHMKNFRKNIAQINVDTGGEDTYEELLKKCVRTALKLKERGVTENDVISSCSRNNENYCVPFIATQFLGAKTATFHPDLSQSETVYLLKLVQPKVIFVSTDAIQFIETCSKEAQLQIELVVFGASEHHSEFSEYIKPQEAENEFKPSPRDVNETAVIVFSSGTTGHPKGICLSHKCLGGQHFVPGDDKDFGPVMLSYSTLYWISGIMILMKSVMYGGIRVVCPQFDAVQTWKIIEKYKVNIIYMVASVVADFINAWQKDTDASSMQLLIIGGDMVSYKLLEDISAALPYILILNVYSQTELGGGGFYPYIVHSLEVKKLAQKIVPAGKVEPDHSWKVVDPSTEEILGPNQTGELRVKSNYVMNGYYKMDSSSAFDSEGYLKTGDLCYYDAAKSLYIESRVKEMFKYRGWQITPTSMEESLLKHPDVEDAAVIGVPHEVDGHHPMAFIKLKKGCQNISVQDIERYVEERLGDHQKLRAGVKFIENIPYSVNGKKLRYKLNQKVLNGQP